MRDHHLLPALALVAGLGVLLPPATARADKYPAGLPPFWNNPAFGLAMAGVPSLLVAMGMWLDDVDDMPTSPRGTLRLSVGHADRHSTNAVKPSAPAMFFGLRTGSFFAEAQRFGAEVGAEFLTFGIDKDVPTEEIDFRGVALAAWQVWRSFDYPRFDAAGEEQMLDVVGHAGLTLVAGVGHVSEPGEGDRNSLTGVPVGARVYWMPYNVFGGEVEVETLVNHESFYLTTGLTIFLNYGPVQLPLTAGVEYRAVTDGVDTLHLIGLALGGF